MRDFSTALALALAIEGMLYALAPAAMQRLNAQVCAMPAVALRLAGLAAACLGVVALWLIRH
ncbi:MAG TPA: DUF2065 domain-containing protein [Stellaceae bacterium]|nr:DUF2065 domain-containing protein [Stellaceae bacterium]